MVFRSPPAPSDQTLPSSRREVCPLIHRAMKERSGDMKRKGAQIVGAMVLLIKALSAGATTGAKRPTEFRIFGFGVL